MLKSILNLEGTKELGKNETKQINGGFSGCPEEGGTCDSTTQTVSCFGGPEVLCCRNGVYVNLGVTGICWP